MTLPTPEWTIWKKIHQTAAAIAHTLQTAAPHLCKASPAPVVNLPTIPPLDLPYPHDILSPIAALKVPNEFRAEINRCFGRRIAELQKEYILAYEKAYSAMSSWPATTFEPNGLRRVYQTMYHSNCLPIIQSQVTTLLRAMAKRQLVTERKRPFNIEYTPLLETYFEHNAYPSALDRRLLAQKSMMTPRQIEVWFQNHRNRAKKDGKALKRLTDSSSQSILESLERKMPHLVVPASERARSLMTDSEDDDSEDEDLDKNQKSETLDFCIDTSATFEEAPPFDRDFARQPFAFPALYWERKPASVSIPTSIVDMDELINAFSSLNMREGVSKKSRKRKPNGRMPSPWSASRFTVPSRAPHPALLRPCPNTPYRPSSFPTVKPFASCVDQYPWPTNFGSRRNASSTRMGPNLPRRTPSTTPFSKYITPIPSSPSLSPFGSRTPSLTSVASTPSRSSSYSSISSHDEPKTPPSLPSQEIVFNQDDIATFEALEALFQGSPAMLDDLLSQNLAFDLPCDEFSKQMPITMPVVPSYSLPSYSTPSYSAPLPAYSDNLNTLLFIPDTNFLQVQF